MVGNKYGKWLKARREELGMTQQELADAALMSRTHIAHIEAGRRLPSLLDAQRLDRALGTGDVLVSFLPEQDISIADYFDAARLLEQQATIIHEFALSYVPGILQTEAYARAVLGNTFPPKHDEERDRQVVTRLERAKILADPVTPVVWALLDEAVLRRPIGGPEVMAAQMMHLVRLVEAGRIRLHILPLSVGHHPLLTAMMTLMWFEDQPPAAYSEAMGFGRLHDSPTLVQRLQHIYELALSDALPAKESLAMLRAAAKEFGHS
ncbi:helix-turn-helix domain-containing protein [Actinacidiphila epipremni]|uniref:Helix-turn-helix transcriptional regulator n=1 Tax=Actinacidiphila epipremni TaxID=2053013 RepID=A0ABX0ZNH6_9ACTN|nr:helix-turn-helix transcriptional regulator [Actinacidiphila epipremni]NJP43379.1 helix-turn-helix transcriptional regulator [Actinacidiphila epipremni]